MTVEQQNRNYIRVNRKYEEKYFPLVKKTIDHKISSLISKLKEDGIDAAIRYLNIDLGNFPLRSVVEKMYEEVGLRHARIDEIELRSELIKSVRHHIEVKAFGGVKDWLAFIRNYLKMFLLEKITFKVNQTTRDHLLTVLNESMKEGIGVTEIVKNLEDSPFSKYQAARIVRTEINRASNVGSYAQGESFEYELQKQWIAVKDKRTRGNPKTGDDDHADHWDMQGQVVDFHDDFRDPRNGHQLQFPGDPSAQAEDTINCRCRFGKKAKRDANGRLIPRRQTTTVIYPGQIRRPQTITI